MNTYTCAQDPKIIATFDHWKAYKAADVCFVSTEPEKSEGDYKRRDEVYLMIGFRQDHKPDGEVSLFIGYTFKNSECSNTVIDQKEFPLYAKSH